ncbi:MAG: hypothetical protein KF810_16775 [Rhizobiaceae bacterium]|nr:hypothetical protein [Rhizobiaceae bacterium]
MFGPNGIFYLLGAAIIGALVAYMKGRLTGARLERNHQRAKDADAYEQSLKELADAADARPVGSMQHDRNNRDNR